MYSFYLHLQHDKLSPLVLKTTPGIYKRDPFYLKELIHARRNNFGRITIYKRTLSRKITYEDRMGLMFKSLFEH